MMAAFGIFMDIGEFPATGLRTIAARETQFNIGNSQDPTNRFIDVELEPLQNATILKSLQCRKGAAPQRQKTMEDRYGQGDFQAH
jgi:hypothetical protein